MRPATLALALIAFPFITIPPLHASENDDTPLANERTRRAIAVWQEYHSSALGGGEK